MYGKRLNLNMSYCRWSSNNWDCAVYCYESVDGFVTHVARTRYVGPIPVMLEISEYANFDEWFAEYKNIQTKLDTLKREKIGLEYDGQTIVNDSKEDFLATLTNLLKLGYHIPSSVIKEVAEEIAEEST